MRHTIQLYSLAIFTLFLVSSSSLFSQVQKEETRVLLLGSKNDFASLTSDEKSAYNFAQNEFDSRYISFDNLSDSLFLLDQYNVVWWHFTETSTMPTGARQNDLINEFKAFIAEGNGIFLSGFATQWSVSLGLEDTLPQEVVKNTTTSGNWGFKPKLPEHPIFRNLADPFITLSSGNPTENLLSWWNIPSTFDGRWLADTEWNSGTLVTAGEYFYEKGKVVVVGAGAYDWFIEGGSNSKASNLSLFTSNILDYLTPQKTLRAGFVLSKYLDGSDLSAGNIQLDEEVQAALNWMREDYDVRLLKAWEMESFEILDSLEFIWWHDQISPSEISSLPTEFKNTLLQQIEEGKGFLLSGTAPSVLIDMGLQTTGELQYLERLDPSQSVGFYVLESSSLIFQDFSNIFITLSSGLNAKQRTVTWYKEDFEGKVLADTEFQSGYTAIGEISEQNKRVVSVGSLAFDFSEANENTQQETLDQLTKAIFNYIRIPNTEKDTALHLSFDKLENELVSDQSSDKEFEFFSNFTERFTNAPDGRALKFDGYTTWLSSFLTQSDLNPEAFSIELGLALESNSTGDVAFVHNMNLDEGFSFGMDAIGVPFFRVKAGDLWHKITGNQSLPKNEWIHLTITFSAAQGLSMYLNGKLIGTKNWENYPHNRAIESPITIGKNPQAPIIAQLFSQGILNGYFDDLLIINKELSPEEINQRATAYVSSKVEVNFDVPTDFYDGQIHRPVYHPMPASDWTNEPHGLIGFNDEYHLFFQKNPTGPFFRQLHWGHLTSTDLLSWRERPYAFAPDRTYDRAGTWSGAVVEKDNVLYSFYTSVDGAKASISLATSTDGRTFVKHPQNPLISSAPSDVAHYDFRDPYLWKHEGVWQMIVGAGLQESGGALFHYRSTDLLTWEYVGVIQPGVPGSWRSFWEMPVLMDFGDKKVLVVVPIPENGEPADAIYWVGEWLNETFVADHEAPKYLESINHLLSPSVMRTSDERYLAIGIVPDFKPASIAYEEGWIHTYSLVREYRLEGGTLKQRPYKGLAGIRQRTHEIPNITLSQQTSVPLEQRGKTLEVSFTLVTRGDTRAGIDVFSSSDRDQYTRLRFNGATKKFELDLNASSSINGVIKGFHETRHHFYSDTNEVTLYLDRSILEVFINDSYGFAKRMYPDMSSDYLHFFSENGSAEIMDIRVHEIDNTLINSVTEQMDVVPNHVLHPNYPNPFNPSTNISFTLAKPDYVDLVIYDVLGREIDRLYSNKLLGAGNHTATWDTSSRTMPTGMYLVKMKSSNSILFQKMTLIK